MGLRVGYKYTSPMDSMGKGTSSNATPREIRF